MIRRAGILLIIGGLVAAAAMAGYALGNDGSGTARAALVEQVTKRLRAHNPTAAKLLLRDAVTSGLITGAQLQSHGGSITTFGTLRDHVATTPMPRKGTLQIASKPPLANATRLESVIAGLLIALAAALAAALLAIRLLPHVLRPDLLPKRPRRPAKAPRLDAEYLARHDALTALPNRLFLQEEAQTRIMRGTRPLALILMDLNEFKEVNDTLGHFAGDQLLRQVGERLAKFAREPGTLVARLGGDEFAVLREEVEAAEAEELAARISDTLARPFQIAGMTLALDVSLGIALAPLHAADYEGLLQRADTAMYAAKRGNTIFALHTNQHETEERQKLALASDLRRAIDEGQLTLHYQPKAVLATGDIAGVEALVRWNHPERGLIPPATFIPLAERNSLLIRDLSLWVIGSALDQAAQWRDAGLHIPVSVNLSAKDVIDLRLPGQIADALARFDVPAELLDLEITESVLMADPARARSIVTKLGELGATTTIDDFGAGYSSLAYLKRLPVHALKIDRSFVLGMTENTHDATIVQAVVDLAHNLGLRVVAEGAEEMAVWERLREAGCDEAQGYLLAQPMPPEKATAWLLRRCDLRAA
jgi:diguanylate cyclase (GGDEF)-like protein